MERSGGALLEVGLIGAIRPTSYKLGLTVRLRASIVGKGNLPGQQSIVSRSRHLKKKIYSQYELIIHATQDQMCLPPQLSY